MMEIHRLDSMLLAVAPLALALAACGSQDQSSGLIGVTLESAVVVNEVCTSNESTGLSETVNYNVGACVLSASCTYYENPCSFAGDPATCVARAAAVCADLDVQDHGSDDWIELVNLTSRDLDLEGYYLSDSSKHPLKSRLPRGSVIPAHGYLVFYANEAAADRDLSFRLRGGESVVLSSPSGGWLDQLAIPAGERGSWGRVPDGTGPAPDSSCFFPTPGWDNSTQCATESP
ncbi:MAG: lamin tail domain-containing protein [Polyangiaceae bacterium]|nr:lamin tail domain-containing protein [Polyangiaceae bacterium]